MVGRRAKEGRKRLLFRCECKGSDGGGGRGEGGSEEFGV